ncbi:MAG: LysM peptidoglycan-binding domain-containing protein [Verrucomicrobia bacterium]|nr:LysM peptidoglycan-binding domain-containing protein [Verrucomicrobiota bacterium]
MLLRLCLLCALPATALAQTTSSQVELANLREDVRGLVQRVGELSLRVEQLERENGDLRRKSADGARGLATVAQLNDAVADLHRTVKSAVAASQNETLQIVSAQLEKLGKQTNAAFEALAKSQAPRPVAPPPARAESAVPKDPAGGTTYTVQKGDSLASIAKKTGAKQQDIITANKLADPSLIKVGETLIIPGAK